LRPRVMTRGRGGALGALPDEPELVLIGLRPADDRTLLC
jgi:hypothetical protein